jgi:hypothetical protein
MVSVVEIQTIGENAAQKCNRRHVAIAIRDVSERPDSTASMIVK